MLDGIQTARQLAYRARRNLRLSWLMLRMAGGVILFSAFVKLLPLSRALELISPQRRSVLMPAVSPQRLAALLDGLLRKNVLAFTPTCWKRAAVLHRYLALSGIETRIVFGVRKAGENVLAGHAWLEAEGRPFLEATPPDYIVTYTFPEPGNAR